MDDDKELFNPPVDADPTAAKTGETGGADLPELSRPELRQQPPGQALDPALDSPRSGGMGGMAGTLTPTPASDES